MVVKNHKDFVDENHGPVSTDDLRILTSSKWRKLISKTPNFWKAMSINWNECKREIETGLDSRLERIISTNPKVTTEEFIEWKRKILQKVDNKIISLKHWIKIHKTNHMLKQGALIEYLNELHEKFVFVSINKSCQQYSIICE